MIPQKYADLGFQIIPFGARSMAISRNNKPIYVFSTACRIKDDMISAICECNLKHTMAV